MKDVIELFQSFWDLLLTIQLTDIVDIALVAFVIYKLLTLVRSTSTWKIVKGVAVILVLSWVTGVFNLHSSNYIIGNILSMGILALLILFQPELRRMIEHLGTSNLRNLFGDHPTQNSRVGEMISQTVQACEAMSRDKVGALIVFERKTSLDEYTKAGTVVDARVSEQLLRNVFFPKAALHDGAMVIRDNRVYAAGCVMPLSNNHNISADLGTRHRAGLGTSEVSDAVVVIVSEETGTISVAVGGMLKRHLAPQTLEKLLKNELAPETEENNGPLGGKLLQRYKKKGDKHEK